MLTKKKREREGERERGRESGKERADELVEGRGVGLEEEGAWPSARRGREKERQLLGIIYQYPSKPRIRMRRFRGTISGARGEGANPLLLPLSPSVRDSG